MKHSSSPVILVVDHDPEARQLFRSALSFGDYCLCEANTATAALAQVEALEPTLILTEFDLPDMEGVEMIRRIYRKKHEAPIIVVSARCTSQNSIIAALDAGADDCVPKPFSIGELGARVRVALRHAATDMDRNGSLFNLRRIPRHEAFRDGALEVDFHRRKVQVSGRDVHLTPVEYQIFSLLIANADRVLSYNHFLGNAWKWKKDRQPQHVRVQIANLRRKLEPDPAKPRHLVTEPGVGYQFHSYDGKSAPA